MSSLQGLEPERVLYIGSFSKILSPALRLGYLVLPCHLVEACRSLKWFSDLHTSSLDQLVLARYIESGGLERHIAKMKKLYRSRRDVLLRCLKEAFGEEVDITGQSTGLHFVVSFRGIKFTEERLASLLDDGVRVYPVEYHTLVKGRHEHRIILGYGHLNDEQLREGARRLMQGLSELRSYAAGSKE
ncbi:PLP-dependent aminotransferase family protein [Paenibacillus sp. 1011MAR3C5]|nr:PLP-dependent aminotransferase family protein [Paenibacillus sp. 1011MAR3C5]